MMQFAWDRMLALSQHERWDSQIVISSLDQDRIVCRYVWVKVRETICRVHLYVSVRSYKGLAMNGSGMM